MLLPRPSLAHTGVHSLLDNICFLSAVIYLQQIVAKTTDYIRLVAVFGVPFFLLLPLLSAFCQCIPSFFSVLFIDLSTTCLGPFARQRQETEDRQTEEQ